jgi:phospholipase/carboxylesterase
VTQLLRTRIADLDTAVVSPSGAAPARAVVLCHGYGAPGEDLVPIASELGDTGNTRFYFPAAPDAAVGAGFGRAWWQIDLPRIVAQRSAGDRSGREETPEGLARARRRLVAFLETVIRQTGLSQGRIVLGGFSQGAMLATDVALRSEERPAGLVVLSGSLVNADEWRRRAPIRAGLRVFQSHGEDDPLLPFDDALALRDLFAQAGLAVELHRFRGGHELPVAVLEALGRFLAATAES